VAGVLAAVAAGGLAVAIGVALLLSHIVSLRTSADASLRTGSYLDATIAVERLVVDAETGLRGYVITSDALFLAPERSAVAQMPPAAAALERAARREGSFVPEAESLATAARAYLTSYVPRVIRLLTSDPAAARSLATTALGKQLVDGIRTRTARLEQLISARQSSRLRSARTSANSAVTVGVVVLIVLTALTVGLAGALGWLLVGRERARERASFLAEASALLDRPISASDVLETFARLLIARGYEVWVAEELATPAPQESERELARADAGDRAALAGDGRHAAKTAWDQAVLTARTECTTATASASADTAQGLVHVLALAGVARRSLVARVVVARRGRNWRREDVAELTGLVGRLALALHARALQAHTEALYRASEQTALTLQRSLLPARIPDIPSCELAIRFTPAGDGELVGGDFYDVFAVGSDRWALAIGDVCGKGAGAATVTAMARWTLRSLAGTVRAPSEVMQAVNDAMLRQNLDGRFITLAYALLEARDGEARVTLACAGHPPAIRVSPSGEATGVPAFGDLLGVWRDIRLEEAELRLKPGEGLVLYTDGVTDNAPARPPRLAAPGVARSPVEALRNLTGERSAGALADALQHEAERWSGVTRDDVAIVALRFLPGRDHNGQPGLTVPAAGA
jgi:serine phosphatase RsbU (regulator of sigma subunit)/CHASE3 domain sensor protein